ncbi:MAG: TolC family protein [Bacteroidetes bacterium]|jgi:cobalt-zinc-cadmium resistance protein CzcA|nr:TolC family protein [Bacteroidota bacterium]MDF1867907.1 TolC family protein [Saprospiraceae bacterium]
MKRQSLIYISFLFLSFQAFAQYPLITLEGALDMAHHNNTGLKSGKLLVDQKNKIADAGILRPPAQVYLSSEEFNFKNQTGVHSLNLQQNFYLPKTIEAQKKVFQSGVNVAEKQLDMTARDLNLLVTSAYYKVMMTKKEKALAKENLDLYVDFLNITKSQLDAGETGKIPKLAARSRLGQAQMALDHSNEQYQIALSLFNQILRSDIVYDVAGELPTVSSFSYDDIVPENPHLQIQQAKIEMASSKVKQQETQLLPQINSGLKLQTANDKFPLFAYQLGVNVPLFKKAYRGQTEAAEIGVKIQQSKLEESRNKLELTITELRFRLQHALHVLVYLQEELAPIVNEQKEVNFLAYREGEIRYLEYLDSLEQFALVKKQYLTALYEFNVLKLELDYWLGN